MAITPEMKEKWKQQAIQNQQKAHDMIHDIGANYAKNPEQIAELLEFGSKFYQYSLNNMKLVYSQNRYAQYVQSFEAWKEMNAPVKKGQSGIKIFVPVQVTVLKLDGNKTVSLSDATEQQKALYKSGQIQGKKVIHFKIGNVFDISQTDYPPEKYPELFNVGVPSEKHADLVNGLQEYCSSIGITVTYEDVKSIALRGYYSHANNQIVVNELLNDTQKLSTLSHELGHALEEHGTRDISTSQKEFEADSISILIQSHFGIELTETRKSHLAEHYRKFEDEIRAAEPAITKDDIVKKVDAALTASMKIFRENIDDIQKCVEKFCDLEDVKTSENKNTKITEEPPVKMQMIQRRRGR